MDLLKLCKTATTAAIAAGNIIKLSINKNITIEHKKGGTNYASQVLTAVDKACEQEIFSHLLPTCDKFDIAMLSEETEDDGSRFQKDFFWCVDPMDGTLAFINKYPGFSVSIALVAKNGIPQIGVVYDPSSDTLYQAVKGHGAYRNGSPWIIKHTHDYLSYYTDRKLADTPRSAEITDYLHNKLINLKLTAVQEISGAGAVLNAMHVLENGPACMFKFPKKENGGGSIWDYAATHCIYQELGFPATNYNGGKLMLNEKGDTFMNKQGVFYGNFTV